MTECNTCGDCCDPVVLPFTKRELAAMTPGDQITAVDRAFVLEYFTQLPRKEGLHRATHFNGRFDRLAAVNTETGAVDVNDRPVFYRCAFFDDDPTSRTYRMCTAHDKRPPLCRGFPWYDRPPTTDKFLPLDCSFRADQAVKLTTKEDARGHHPH